MSMDDREMRKFEATLGLLASKALGSAERRTLNVTAFEARTVARDLIAEKMVQRNQFTRNSIRVDQARKPGDFSRMGSIAHYMADQEFGATQTSKRKHGIAIPTSYSAGQGHAGKRTKVPTRPNKMQSIQLRRGGARVKNQRQQNRIAIEQASRKGSKFVFLDLYRRKGIFRVIGRGRAARVEMVHDLTRKSVVIPKNPIIGPAAIKAGSRMPQFYRDALEYQLKRLGFR